jgi:hypothetical protein
MTWYEVSSFVICAVCLLFSRCSGRDLPPRAGWWVLARVYGGCGLAALAIHIVRAIR